MRAVALRRFGGPEVLEVVMQPTPEPGFGQVRVQVKAAGVNLSHALLRQNRYAITPDLPTVLGDEVAGVIDAIGPGVEGLRVGTRVAGPLFAGGTIAGGYAEYALIAAELVVPLPDALRFDEALALMVQGLTALYLTRQASPRNRTVLVNAAAGGVGSLLVQQARREGARRIIAGVSSDAKADFAREMGADAVVNYSSPGWMDAARAATDGAGPDLIYESVGGDITGQCLQVLAPGGELVIYGALNIQQFQLGVPELLGLIFRNQSITGFAVAPLLTPETLRAGLSELFAAAVRGELRVTIGGSYPLERTADAHRALESRGTRGKLVLVP